MADEIVDDVAAAITPEPGPVEVLDHRDDVHNDVAAAIASLKPEPAAIEGTAEVVSERPRAPDGKFLPKDAAPEVAAAPDPKLAPAENVTKASEQPSQAAAPPVSWAPEAKALWASAPPALQQAVLKREMEASNGIRQYSEKVAQYEQVLNPIAHEAQRRGMNVADATKRLLDGNTFLEQQPEQAILWLAQKNGIDLANLASNPPAIQQQRPDPHFAQVSQTVQSLQQQFQQIQFGQNKSLVEQFAASPEAPHYADVEATLPGFIKEVLMVEPDLSGVALLQKAYDRAVWLNPDVRAKVQAAQNAEAEKTRLAQVQAKATQAGKAAISVKGSSANASPPRQPVANGETVYDDVRAAMRQVSH